MYLLDNDLAHLVDTYRKIKAGTIHRIPFAYLWHLYRPGQDIVARNPKYQVYRVLQVSAGRKFLVGRSHGWKKTIRKTVSSLAIDCFYLDFDGKQFNAVPTTIYIKPYDDALPITALEVYPLEYEREASEKELIERDRKFRVLVRVTHQRYKGVSLKQGDYLNRDDEVCVLFQSADPTLTRFADRERRRDRF